MTEGNLTANIQKYLPFTGMFYLIDQEDIFVRKNDTDDNLWSILQDAVESQAPNLLTC